MKNLGQVPDNLGLSTKTKEELFNILWVRFNYCLLGYPKDDLFKSLTKEEMLSRLKELQMEDFLE
jgi:hypothetical protein